LSLGFFWGLFWVFFSGSRVFLLGFLVGFGLGPLGVFLGFFLFLCWLWLLVYTPGVLRGALRFLINLLIKKKKYQDTRLS
jgi:Na+/H+-dicarboxylate symporter